MFLVNFTIDIQNVEKVLRRASPFPQLYWLNYLFTITARVCIISAIQQVWAVR